MNRKLRRYIALHPEHRAGTSNMIQVWEAGDREIVMQDKVKYRRPTNMHVEKYADNAIAASAFRKGAGATT